MNRGVKPQNAGSVCLEGKPASGLLQDGEDEARWDDYVRGRQDGTFFHLSGWRRVIGGFLGHDTYYLYAEVDGAIRGVLPLAHVKSPIFSNALISLPFLVYGGPVADSPDILQVLLEKATELASELKVDYLELRNRDRVTDWPAKNTYVTFRRSIDPEVEANLLSVPRKQRAMIRKGIKLGLETDLDSSARRLHRLLSECKRNLGTPFFSHSYLQHIKDVFADECEIMVVTHEGEDVCAVMSFLFRDEVLPYYGGGPSAARDLYGNDFMYWKVMERACEKGLRIFDYGRSQEGSGAYRFKKHWGFEPVPLSYEYYLVKAQTIPRLDPANPKYRWLINGWAKLPLFVSRLLGPPIARWLG